MLKSTQNSADFPIAWYDLIRLNSIVCRLETIRCTTTKFSLIFSVINWLRLNLEYWYGYFETFVLILRIKYLLPRSLQKFDEFAIVWRDWNRLKSVVCRALTTWSTMLTFSRVDSVINWLFLKGVYWQGCQISNPSWPYCIWNSNTKNHYC